MKIKQFLLVLFFISFLSFTSAIQYDNNTVINSLGLNSSITFNRTIDSTYQMVATDYIFLKEITYTLNGTLYICGDYNLTTNNSLVDSSMFDCASNISDLGWGGINLQVNCYLPPECALEIFQNTCPEGYFTNREECIGEEISKFPWWIIILVIVLICLFIYKRRRDKKRRYFTEDSEEDDIEDEEE